MAQADRVYNTPPTNTSAIPSRRSFLSNAAGLAAGGTALALAAPLPAGAATPDPVFAMIERHRELSAAFDVAVKNADNLEEHPEQESLDAIVDDTSDALLDHADALIITEPTTVAGIAAVMRYFASLEDWQEPRDSEEWETSDGASVNWHQAFLDTLANALQGARS